MPALPACATDYPNYYSAEAIEARVVDAETRQPIEGVIVTANWQLLGGMEGSLPLGQMQVMETQTGPDGVFNFPAWGPLKRPKGYLREGDPQLLLFKPGYAYRALVNEVRSKINYDPIRRSVWNGKTIEMKPFKGTVEEYAKKIYWLSTDMDRIHDFARGAKTCTWKSTPQMLVALHKISADFEKQNVRPYGGRIHRIEDIPTYPECGSPEEYFKEFLP
jgi:hypothetical protein